MPWLLCLGRVDRVGILPQNLCPKSSATGGEIILKTVTLIIGGLPIVVIAFVVTLGAINYWGGTPNSAPALPALTRSHPLSTESTASDPQLATATQEAPTSSRITGFNWRASAVPGLSMARGAGNLTTRELESNN
jgi:hypothetical protein